MNAIETKLSALSLDQVAEIAARVNADFSDESGIILDAALEILQTKMPEADFVRFCEKLA